MIVTKLCMPRRIWFWITCWLPVTKYRMSKMYQMFINFGQAVEKDHIRFNNDIAMLKKQVEVNDMKKNSENIEKGMFQ